MRLLQPLESSRNYSNKLTGYIDYQRYVNVETLNSGSISFISTEKVDKQLYNNSPEGYSEKLFGRGEAETIYITFPCIPRAISNKHAKQKVYNRGIQGKADSHIKMCVCMLICGII